MIISVSRRTDIPNYYSEWFLNRTKEGFVLVRNPVNFRQISRIRLAPDVVDGIVFWTKNPAPIISRLPELDEYMYYFQFTLTPYGKDIEPNIPEKSRVLAVFKRLSEMIGPDRVIWRYDPILINEKYTVAYHLDAFGRMAEELRNYTRKVTISFVDENYRGVKLSLRKLALSPFSVETQVDLASRLAEIARSCGLAIDACAEKIDLQRFGIEHARCIDDRLFEKLLGCRLNVDRDKDQRPECRCATSIDIGMYNTCLNGCLYCYANYNPKIVARSFAEHNPLSPLLIGEIGIDDRITEREVRSCKDTQWRLGGL